MTTVQTLQRPSLTLDEIREHAPSVFAASASPKCSERYTFVSTETLLERLMKDGWTVTSASQRRTNRSGRNPDYTKHMVRLSHAKAKDLGGGIFPEIVIINSHDRQSRFQIHVGVLRLVCLNGLVAMVGQQDSAIHIGSIEKILERIEAVLELSKVANQQVKEMQGRKMDERTMAKLAKQAMEAAYGPEDQRFDPKLLLASRRPEDELNDLWTVFNRVQENIMQGGIEYKSENRAGKTRGLMHIGRTVEVNQKLWSLALDFLPKGKAH